tara:strand:- start:708 stop:1154 length:447 start_codon:yes stop_codon:yes gene_type:complete
MTKIFINMQPVDPHKLFDIFSKGDEAIYKEHGVKDALDNSYVLMGMVVRGVENYHLMDVMYSRQYPREYKRNRRSIAIKYFSKLESYLERIKDDPIKVIEDMENGFDLTQIVIALDFLREFFEKIEHYEKCAVIKTYIDACTTFTIES